MLFRVSPTNWAARLCAAAVVAALGGLMILSAGPPLRWAGWLIIAISVAAGIPAIVSGVVSLRDRPDRYDLNRLWEKEPDSVDPEAEEKRRDLAYCHHCGASCPEAYAICPDCGNKL